jgi:uncharacterized protein (UPF0335 family)
MKKRDDARISRLQQREAELKEKIKDIEKEPNISNKELKLERLNDKLARVTEKIKELISEKEGVGHGFE